MGVRIAVPWQLRTLWQRPAWPGGYLVPRQGCDDLGRYMIPRIFPLRTQEEQESVQCGNVLNKVAVRCSYMEGVSPPTSPASASVRDECLVPVLMSGACCGTSSRSTLLDNEGS